MRRILCGVLVLAAAAGDARSAAADEVTWGLKGGFVSATLRADG